MVAIVHVAQYIGDRGDNAQVGDVRNRGLMEGIEIVKNKGTKESFPAKETVGAKLCKKMRDKGLMMRPLGDVIVVMPPIAIGTNLLKEMLDIIADSIENELPEIVRGI